MAASYSRWKTTRTKQEQEVKGRRRGGAVHHGLFHPHAIGRVPAAGTAGSQFHEGDVRVWSHGQARQRNHSEREAE
ncbi:hypothetical protein, partial [Enterococcus faecalis]|uniref:hypothetical protein n=1 Tax=Enterococcus faecalis TaxID=1351 RepID=UPI00403F8082